MRSTFPMATAFLVLLMALPAGAQTQQKQDAPARIDPAQIRQMAKQRAEFRALLSDPDADVRLLTMREAIVNGDAMQRSAAIEAGLASNETAMLEQALRGVMVGTHAIVIEFLDKDGKLTTEGDVASMRLVVTSFDAGTGRIEGTLPCGNDPKFVGQLQGVVLTFRQDICTGTLVWSSETGDFRGRVNLHFGEAKWNRNAVWKPR